MSTHSPVPITAIDSPMEKTDQFSWNTQQNDKKLSANVAVNQIAAASVAAPIENSRIHITTFKEITTDVLKTTVDSLAEVVDHCLAQKYDSIITERMIIDKFISTAQPILNRDFVEEVLSQETMDPL